MPVQFKLNRVAHSSHFHERTVPVKYIIIHCFANTPEEQIKVLDMLGLSVHYIIGRDCTITEVLSPNLVAYHAGQSHWQNSPENSLNNCSIGIEIEAPHLGQSPKDYSTGMMKKVYSLINMLCMKYKIRRENILGHSDIAPARKPDPGVYFPWKKLYRYDMGLWYNLHCLSKETDETVLLQKIGYDTSNLPAARYAFCRRFFPSEIFVEQNIQHLLIHPYPPNFIPKDYEKYLLTLRAVALSFQEERQKRYWYLEK